MTGNAEAIKVLKEVLRKELASQHQSLLHSLQDVQELGLCGISRWRMEGVHEEMKHADEIIERILLLDGTLNLSGYDKINVGSTVKLQLENDFGLEEGLW